MLADQSNTPPGVAEQYATTVSSGGGRVGDDHTIRTPGDLVAAAGMNRHRTGLALSRLMSEWNRSATPALATVPDVKQLAREAADQRFTAEVNAKRQADEGAGKKPMPRVEAEALRAKNPVVAVDKSVAEAEARRLTAQATDWQLEEHKLRFQGLKALPWVRMALTHYAAGKGWEGPEHIVAAVLQRFLSPMCHACKGRQRLEIAGTGRLGKMNCRECRGTGEAKVPHGGRGKALLAYMTSCIGWAAADLREGGRMRRSPLNVENRAQHTERQRQEMQVRVAEEAGRDDDRTAAELQADRERFAMRRVEIGKRKRPGDS